MLELNFFNILIHVLNILLWVGIALWIVLGIRWMTICCRRGSAGVTIHSRNSM